MGVTENQVDDPLAAPAVPGAGGRNASARAAPVPPKPARQRDRDRGRRAARRGIRGPGRDHEAIRRHSGIVRNDDWSYLRTLVQLGRHRPPRLQQLGVDDTVVAAGPRRAARHGVRAQHHARPTRDGDVRRRRVCIWCLWLGFAVTRAAVGRDVRRRARRGGAALGPVGRQLHDRRSRVRGLDARVRARRRGRSAGSPCHCPTSSRAWPRDSSASPFVSTRPCRRSRSRSSAGSMLWRERSRPGYARS